MPGFNPKGHRGSWFAIWQGQPFPCVHKHWHRGDWYEDPYVEPDIQPKWHAFLAAIKNQGKVIETTDRVPDDERRGSWRRSGYVGLWEIDNYELQSTTDPGRFQLRFRFAKRLA
jgi:hypothetical protein